MCRNHSHIACETIGVAWYPEGRMDLLRCLQRTEVQSPYGPDLSLQPGQILLLPSLTMGDWQALAAVLTAGRCTSLYYRRAEEWTPIAGVPKKPRLYSPTGQASYADGELLIPGESEGEYVPF